MTEPRDKSYEASLLERLREPAEAAAYIDAVLETGDQAALLLALRQVAGAHGMAEVARRAELGETTCFETLASDGTTTLATLTAVLHAVGLRLTVTSEHV